MAWRIHDYVVRGEIDNRVRGKVTGLIWFVGREEPVKLELTGNAWRNLAGRRIEFINRLPKPGLPETFGQLQNGVTGDMTASRRVKVLDVSVEEAMRMSKAGQKFPYHWANSVYFEWFSIPNGRVVIESADYQLTISTEDPTWEMTEEEEKVQQGANAAAIAEFLSNLSPAPGKSVEITGEFEDVDEGEPEFNVTSYQDQDAAAGEEMAAAADAEDDEAEEDEEGDADDEDAEEAPLSEDAADKLMAEAERLTDALQARIEAAGDSADLESILDEELKRWRRRNGEETAASDDAIVRSTWDDVISEAMEAVENDPALREEIDAEIEQRHPLAERARELSLHVMKDGNEHDWVPAGATTEHPVGELIGSIMKAGGKMAGALDGREWPPEVSDCALTIAWLKRARGYYDDALLAAESCEEDKLVDADWLYAVKVAVVAIAAEVDGLIDELRARLSNA